MNIDEKLVRMILETKISNINEIVIMPAIKLIMQKLVKRLQNKRVNGRVYNGTLNGVNVSIIRSMIGCPHTAMTLECLRRTKAKCIIRVDVCGGLKRDDFKVDIGNIIVPNSALCGDGTSPSYIANYPELEGKINSLQNPFPKFQEIQAGNPLIFIAKPDLYLKDTIFSIGKKSFRERIKETSIWTTDAMFCETESFIQSLKSSHVGAIDMESSIIFLLGQLFNLKTVSILSVSDLPGDPIYDMFKTNKIHPDLEKGMNDAIKIVLEALPKIKLQSN
ncbi:MAG: phosphorylase family protein [Promethearchaeota archaeon]